MKRISDVEKFAELVAEKQGWSLNRDSQLLSDILKGLLVNYDRYGFFLCPCRDSWGIVSRDKDIKCPCSYSSDDINEFSRCYCGLFTKSGAVESDLESIVPDRRPEKLYPD